MGAAVSTTIDSATVAIDAIAPSIVELLVAGPVPRSAYLQQLRRSVKGCEKPKPVHIVLALSLDLADNLEVPIGQVTDPYEQLAEILRERRRIRLEALAGGATHAIAGPSILRDIQRANRFEDAENQAEDAVLVDDDDPAAIQALLDRSEQEIHETQRRNARLRARRAQLLLRKAG